MKITSIDQLKELVLGIMDSVYGSSPSFKPTEATDAQIETACFMRATDAQAIRKCCSSSAQNLKVSFRVAGQHTIDRINAGNPCKGHDISNKSIKEMGTGYTYEISADEFATYKGLVGCPAIGPVNLGEAPKLAGVWKLGTDLVTSVSDGSMPKPDGSDAKQFFTGDYDMHDLLKGNALISAGPGGDYSAIDILNRYLLGLSSVGTAAPPNVNDTARSTIVNALYKQDKRTFLSPYALIRHGAQTSFMSFLLSNSGMHELDNGMYPGRLPSQDGVLNIGSPIVMFDENLKAYILNSVREIYWYYKYYVNMNIPFYYFFKDMGNYNGQLTPDQKNSLDNGIIYINNILYKTNNAQQ